MSCNLIYSGNQLTQVVNDQGTPSLLYQEAVNSFGKEKALEIYLTSKSDEFLEVYGVIEPKLETVVKYLTGENQNEKKLNPKQQVSLKEFAMVNASFSVDKLLSTFYNYMGIFEANPKKLKDSNLYNDLEVLRISKDVELQETIKESLEALKNTDNLEYITTDNIISQSLVTGNQNSFGKFSPINPFIVEKEVLKALSGSSLEDFNEGIEDFEVSNKSEMYEEVQKHRKSEVYVEIDGEISPKMNTETETSLPIVAKLFSAPFIDNFLSIRGDVLEQNVEQVKKVIKSIEDISIKNGIDVIGLSEKPLDENMFPFLGVLNNFIKNPSVENTSIFAQASDVFFERNLQPETSFVKSEDDLEFVKLNTQLTEEEVYNKQGFIKHSEGVYVKSAKEDLETLYTNLETYPEKYPKGVSLREYVQSQIKDFKSAEIAEAIYLYKMYFNISQNSPKTDNVENFVFNGNEQYLTEEFPSDFWAKALKAKQLNNDTWVNYYSNFGVNANGLYLINDDQISISNIKIYADNNLIQYSILSKQMPTLSEETSNVVTKDDLRNNIANNPQTLESFQGKFYKINDSEIIIKDSQEDFIKVLGDVYEHVDTLGDTRQFAKLEAVNSEYNTKKVRQPKAITDIKDYSYLNNQPEEFTKVKETKEEIVGFDC